ncbi:MAG: hypothetical protein CVU77_02890 [Elusimicrobia bacterium HGW-Elusimicrobia-1]|jgi:hypothetical protein|nr:MAG: hypothetical protein CVU77_02890 [Elusimicrobia bacterium HGW-Elusimicrobia-1]
MNKKIKILSLGCGFAPDFLAATKYISDNDLSMSIDYHGIDMNDSWKSARYELTGARFSTDDVSVNIDLSGYDIVIIGKLFSTLMKNSLGGKFLDTFRWAVSSQLKKSAFVIFNDINSRNKGRDVFHNRVCDLFTSVRQYYCDDPPYKGASWIPIPENHIVCSIPIGFEHSPLREIRQSVFFEYKK